MSPGRFGRALGSPKGAPGDAFERHRQPLESLKNVCFCCISINGADQGEHWWVPWGSISFVGRPWGILRRFLGALSAFREGPWGVLERP